MTEEHHEHEFPPVYDKNSKILILGSFPSVKSREQGFYYGHPQNRFWKVLAGIFSCPVPQSIEEKRRMLLENGIAVWDVIAECDITGSSDSSIKNVTINDFHQILDACDISVIYANGGTAKRLYEKYARDVLKRDIIGLPSTSPANAAFSVERLIQEWSMIKKSF